LQHYGEYLLPLLQRLGSSPLSELLDADGGDAVYFDICGRYMLVVPQTYVWPVVGVCGVLFVMAALLCLGDALKLRGWLVSGIGFPFLAAAMYFGVKAAVPFLVLPGGKPPWGMPYAGMWIAGGVLLSVFSLTLAGFRWLSTTPVGRSGTLGVGFYWLLLCVAAAIYMPGAAYITVIPVIALVLAVLLWRIPLLAGLFMCVVPVVWMSLLVGMYLLMGPGLLPELSIVTVLLAATLAPLARACRGLFEGIAGTCALVCIVALFAFPKALPTGEQTSGLAYWSDTDLGKAVWLSTDTALKGFEGSSVSLSPTRQDGRKYVPDWGFQVLASNTAPVGAGEIGDVVRKDDVWTLVVPDGCREVYLSTDGPMAINVNGVDVTDGEFCRVIVPARQRIYVRKLAAGAVSLRVHYVHDGLPKGAGARRAGWLPSPVNVRGGIGLKTDIRIYTFGMLLN
jgi:hypothetical protein